jgi:hypothetical protein
LPSLPPYLILVPALDEQLHHYGVDPPVEVLALVIEFLCVHEAKA